MPRAGTTMTQAQLRARYWGNGRFAHAICATNQIPRTNGDVFLAITNTNSSRLLDYANTLAKIVCGNNPQSTMVIGGIFTAQFYPDAMSMTATTTTPLYNFFTRNGRFLRMFRDDYGMTLEGVELLHTAITRLLGCLDNRGENTQVETANRKIADLERQLSQSTKVAQQLRKDIADLEKLCADNNIERPIECLNCGKHKTDCEDFGIKVVKPRMASFGVSKYANDYYITSTGNWVKCENPEEGNGGQYKETEGAVLAFFGNAWNSCSKQEGDEGLCMDCSMTKLGMLTPKKITANKKTVGGFTYYTPTCCFHMGCADDCGIKWGKASQLLCKQIPNVAKVNASPMDARRGRLPTITPSMVKSTGQFCCENVEVIGRGINGAGDTYATAVATWMGEVADWNPMATLVEAHIQLGRTHTEQVANRATIAEQLAQEAIAPPTQDTTVRAPDAQIQDTLLPNDVPMPPTSINHNGNDYNFHSIYTYSADPATTLHFAIYGVEGGLPNGGFSLVAYDSNGLFVCQSDTLQYLYNGIHTHAYDSDSDSTDSEEDA